MEFVEHKIISLAQIDDSNRLRPIDPDYVKFLAISIRERGLDTPLHVGLPDKKGLYKLIAGGHRKEAVAEVGGYEAPCLVFSGDALEQRLHEIDENLFRHELNAFDRAVFLAERKAVYEILYPEAKQGGDRRNKDDRLESLQTANLAVWSFAADAAEKVGLSERAIRRAIEFYDNLSNATRDKIRGSDLARNQSELIALSKLGPDLQNKVVAALFDTEAPAQNVKHAVQIVEGHTIKPDDPTERQVKALIDAWTRANAKARKQFLSHLQTLGAI